MTSPSLRSGPAAAGATRSWYRSFEDRAGASARLYCFPFAGGAASVYRPWLDVLPRTFELRAMQLPGRQDRLTEAPFTDLGALVGALADELAPELDELPFAFFGHSMGALVSFELTRELRRRGLPLPRLVGLSGWPAPPYAVPRLPMADLSDEQFTAAVKRYGGMPGPVLASPELLELVLPVLRADFTVCQSLDPAAMDLTADGEEPLPMPLSVFGGEEDAFVPAGQLAGWAAQTSRSANVRVLPGRHFYLVRQVRRIVTDLVADLRTELELEDRP